HLLRSAIALDPSDPRRMEPSLVVETIDERYEVNTHTFISSHVEEGQPEGDARYSGEWDTDSDGTTDVPATLPGHNCLEAQLASADQERFRVLRDRCLADSVAENYDVGRDTLRLYPRTPLQEGREYAVLLTDRLLDTTGRPVTSPFVDAVHPRQRALLDRLMTWVGSPSHQRYFGDLSNRVDRVRVAWSFTTGTPLRDLSELANRVQPALSTASASTATGARMSLDRYFDLDAPCATGTPRGALASLLSASLGLSTTQREALVDALTAVGAIVTGRYFHPPYAADPGALPSSEESSVPLWIAVPRVVPSNSSLHTIILSQERTVTHLEGLRWAGQWASLGMATLGFERIGSSAAPSPNLNAQLQEILNASCSPELLVSLLAVRQDARASANDTRTDVDPMLLATRDRWRTDAVELATLARVLDGSTQAAFDSPSIRFTSAALAGIGTGTAPIALAASLLDPKPSLILVDPVTSPERAWRRGATWGAAQTELWRIFGPRVAGVPSTDLEPSETQCLATDASVRLVSPDVPPPGREIGCIALRGEDGARFPIGATVTATNLATLARRCVRMTNRGEFSLGIPADSGDELELSVFSKPNLLAHFGRDQDCGAPEQLPSPDVVLGGAAPEDATARITVGIGGLGLERQSSEVLAAIDYASAAFSLANPAPFLAALTQPTRPSDSNGVLIVLSPGDPSVPPDEALSLANAARLVPRFPPSNLTDYPEQAGETTPEKLAKALRKPTAADRLEWAHLDEGVPRLQRFPPDASSCAPNSTTDPSLESLCHPTCTEDAQCAPTMLCMDGKCQASIPGEQLCSESLPDVDALADRDSPFGAVQPVPSLRLVRYAGAMDANNLEALWQPQFRITGPMVQPTHPDWPLVALSIPLADPWGSHGIVRDDVCHKFRFGNYVPYLVGHFVATRGTAYAPISNRDEQTCLQAPKTSDCDFIRFQR
ncbi:MAG TPA: dickkopf-related protein, partial [Polyangiaceae bacterium]|nr:dickkopf-related protein [Polyangiaceae bacterium]